jgi:uncharacterized metal-binding protein YceD (DUF177 family)
MSVKPEFSRPVAVHDIKPEGLETVIEATADERQKLAKRFDILGIDSLKARVRLSPESDLFRLEARLEADVSQSCVVTLDPVSSHIDVEFSRLYGEGEALEAALQALDADVDLDADIEDEPDPIEGGVIDAGEAVAEELALSLDPFPRKPGASLDGSPWAATEDAQEKPHPFAGLLKLRDKLDKKV